MKKETYAPTIIIDASNSILGRLASYAAKQILLGKHVAIVNCEKAVVTGNKKNILERYAEMRGKGGSAQQGPYFPTKSAAIMKRTVRGMLSHKEGRGHAAFMRVRCYEGMPAEFSESKLIVIAQLDGAKHLTLNQISEELR